MYHGTDQIYCSTCEYWTGERQLALNKNGKEKVDVSKVAMGECENSFSRFFEKSRRQDGKCQHFSRWTEMM